MRRSLTVVVGLATLAVAALGPARPAAADAAKPGNVRSTVTSVTPAAPVTARVRGGDSFLELTVAAGHEAVVDDYEGYPYLRFAADGTVSENRSSKAVYLNRTRSAGGALPAGLDPAGPPTWVRVAAGGTYAWHDHRVHWMSPTRAPEQAWTVALHVDGRSVTVQGRFGPVPAPVAWPWWLAALAAAAAAGLALRRDVRWGAGVGLVAAALTAPVVVGLVRLPGSSWTLGALVVAAAVAGLGALLRPGPVGTALAGGAGVALALWGLRRVAVFDHAVLVTALPPWLDRAAVAAAVGAGLGLLGGVAWVLTRAPVAPDA